MRRLAIDAAPFLEALPVAASADSDASSNGTPRQGVPGTLVLFAPISAHSEVPLLEALLWHILHTSDP
eukprot:CAMPEP_0173393212 /NCGR_PEP_ID=MMETSP1356-20130122/21980_1 /TAXON_ID=77927 ORGANISM="Hemiselmis virescens, Strain PCC157" /NCGR_SAMPLE_ID=MMETSP1356 /ASSEMBLY_ACC=CAM_ASM_000847 /LENGTH=67 /DNA_ID=CAMNT_0014351197 /DNA_START=151 /DNA_END=354 /DNA_ORIENTATION=-